MSMIHNHMLQQKSPGFKPYVTTEIAMIPNHMLQQKYIMNHLLALFELPKD